MPCGGAQPIVSLQWADRIRTRDDRYAGETPQADGGLGQLLRAETLKQHRSDQETEISLNPKLDLLKDPKAGRFNISRRYEALPVGWNRGNVFGAPPSDLRTCWPM